MMMQINSWIGQERSMLFKRKKTAGLTPQEYDREHKRPALRCSICTGEQVAGFRRKDTEVFEEVMLIRSEADLQAFRDAYGIEGEIKKIY